MSSNSPMNLEDAGKPWWTFGHVWLVIAGPVIVIIAGFVTLWLAVSQPDPVIAEDYYQRGLNINETLKEAGGDMTPAMKGRNHAATPLEDQPR
ncbi:FixH family protein [Diaphorobacter nitroreducens]